MSHTFYGLHIARTGLFASQRGLEITGHNISNAGTEGYTRQRLNLTNIEPTSSDSIIRQYTKGESGGGVEIVDIQQVRDQFLDLQFRMETSEQKKLETKYETLYYIEDIINEPSDSGLTSVMLSLYKSLQEFSKKPDAEDVRNLVRQNAITMTETLNYYADKLELQQKEQDDAINISLKRANALLEEIADLNVSIAKFEMSGDNANDLMDKRNLALDKLSEIMNISYEYNERNMVSVYLGTGVNNETDGVIRLIDNNDPSKVNVMASRDGKDKTGKNVFEVTPDIPSHYGRYTYHNVKVFQNPTDGGTEITQDMKVITGGTIKGYFDMRDGDTSENYGIEYILDQLDMFSKAITAIFNDINEQGWSIPREENNNVSATGLAFFDDQGNKDCRDVTALNIQISESLKQSIWNLAGSSAQVLPKQTTPNLSDDSYNSNEGNNENALKFAAISMTDYSDILAGINPNIKVGNLDEFISGIVSELGVQSEYNKTMNENQEIVLNSIGEQRSSVSDVSIDEEITNMITYLKSYQAASRMITAVDEMLDKLINGTGRVGL